MEGRGDIRTIHKTIICINVHYKIGTKSQSWEKRSRLRKSRRKKSMMVIQVWQKKEGTVGKGTGERLNGSWCSAGGARATGWIVCKSWNIKILRSAYQRKRGKCRSKRHRKTKRSCPVQATGLRCNRRPKLRGAGGWRRAAAGSSKENEWVKEEEGKLSKEEELEEEEWNSMKDSK